jgi:mercuric ion transport protein
MTIKDENNCGESGPSLMLLATGGLFSALAASSCCILPLVLFSAGVSGAWIGNFTRLAPFQPVFIAASLACLGVGAWLVRRASGMACAEGKICARPVPRRWVKAALIVAALLVVAAIGFDVFGPLFLS